MMIRYLIFFLFLTFITNRGHSQNIGLAMNYVEQGEYEKAKSVYESLYRANPRKQDYVLGLANVHVQLQEFEEAKALIQKFIGSKDLYPNMFIELGHVYTVEQDTVNANLWYKKAINKVKENVGYAYNVGRVFQNYNLLDQAIEAYEIANAEKPQISYSIQLAKLYGEKGNIEKMFENYIELIEKNEKYIDVIQRNFEAYINDEDDSSSNAILRRLLLSRLQENPNILYNQILSWLFIQEKEFKKAFAQEKAIFKRIGVLDFTRFFDLAAVMTEAGNYVEASEVYLYIKENSQNIDIQIEAILALMEIKILESDGLTEIEKSFTSYLEQYGYNAQSLYLQLQFAEFLAFEFNKIKEANAILENSLNYQVDKFQQSQIQLLLADILVAEEQFNQALIKYSLVSKMVKNTPLAQEASYKTALTSYYKGDFEWALTQLKVLKRATTQTIANDAMEMALFIKQGKTETDSTQQALQKVAKADLLLYQGKSAQAIEELKGVFEVVDNYHIKDQVYYKLGQAYESLKDFPQAVMNYEALLAEYPQSIVADNTLFALALIYSDELKDTEKAKLYLEQLIFDHEDSIFFVEARKRYRKLRGDQNI
jgi:tetratricopeptide (TPR) repeat protein